MPENPLQNTTDEEMEAMAQNYVRSQTIPQYEVAPHNRTKSWFGVAGQEQLNKPFEENVADLQAITTKGLPKVNDTDEPEFRKIGPGTGQLLAGEAELSSERPEKSLGDFMSEAIPYADIAQGEGGLGSAIIQTAFLGAPFGRVLNSPLRRGLAAGLGAYGVATGEADAMNRLEYLKGILGLYGPKMTRQQGAELGRGLLKMPRDVVKDVARVAEYTGKDPLINAEITRTLGGKSRAYFNTAKEGSWTAGTHEAAHSGWYNLPAADKQSFIDSYDTLLNSEIGKKKLAEFQSQTGIKIDSPYELYAEGMKQMVTGGSMENLPQFVQNAIAKGSPKLSGFYRTIYVPPQEGGSTITGFLDRLFNPQTSYDATEMKNLFRDEAKKTIAAPGKGSRQKGSSMMPSSETKKAVPHMSNVVETKAPEIDTAQAEGIIKQLFGKNAEIAIKTYMNTNKLSRDTAIEILARKFGPKMIGAALAGGALGAADLAQAEEGSIGSYNNPANAPSENHYGLHGDGIWIDNDVRYDDQGRPIPSTLPENRNKDESLGAYLKK